MKKFEYRIIDENGIHARPAGLLVKTAKAFESKLTVTKDGESADAKKLFAMMGLCVKKGDTITVAAEGADEDAALAAVSEFLSQNL